MELCSELNVSKMDIDLISKALANPTRRQILEWLKTHNNICLKSSAVALGVVCVQGISKDSVMSLNLPCQIICLFYNSQD